MWRLYGAEWRDLFTVDADGVIVDQRNLTDFDLTVSSNTDTFAELLRGL